MSDTQIFQKACIINLSVGVWGARKKLTEAQLQKLAQNHPEMVSGTKRLVERECLEKIQAKRAEAINYVRKIALPFPIRGLYMVPKDLIDTVDFKCQTFQNEFIELRSEFKKEYNKYREAAREVLEPDGLFDELDYPQDIERKFYFEYQFITIEAPGKKASLLSPELYAREQEKFVNLMEDARGQAINALRTEFATMIERIVKMFTPGKDGKPKRFMKQNVANFYDFFETFKVKNIFDDDELSEIVEKAQAILNGNDVEAIKDDEALQQKIKKSMTGVSKELNKIFQKPRRKLDL